MQTQTRVIVSSTEINVRSGIAQKTGKPYSIREQLAVVDSPRFRQPITLTLGDTQAPYEAGVYELDFEASFAVGRFGSAGLGRLVLQRVADAAGKKAA